MADGAVITFATSVFERDDFFVFALLDHFARHFAASAVRDLIAIDVHQNLERRCFARLDVEKIDIDRVAFRDAILATAGFDNCVSHTGKGCFRGKSRANSHRRTRLASIYSRAEITRTISPLGGRAS